MKKRTLAESRKDMLESISAKADGRAVRVKVRMDDKGVATLLQQLQKFEKDSRKRSIMVS